MITFCCVQFRRGVNRSIKILKYLSTTQIFFFIPLESWAGTHASPAFPGCLTHPSCPLIEAKVGVGSRWGGTARASYRAWPSTHLRPSCWFLPPASRPVWGPEVRHWQEALNRKLWFLASHVSSFHPERTGATVSDVAVLKRNGGIAEGKTGQHFNTTIFSGHLD